MRWKKKDSKRTNEVDEFDMGIGEREWWKNGEVANFRHPPVKKEKKKKLNSVDLYTKTDQKNDMNSCQNQWWQFLQLNFTTIIIF